ncbi:MAG: DUF488 domain-containing protein [Bacteroidetes bacterium]|jgi:uncharacterized protein (DUF488 family)|nr:DUF488 domain-containing protein [Bacteroidota bacterium]
MNTIWTIGHSSQRLDAFLKALVAFEIKFLADVRRYPGSRKFPHFNKEALENSLAENNIRYAHFEALGGRRKVKPNSKNDAWRLDSFRGYADYMETSDFKTALKNLENTALENRTAYMCSEVLWWRCHRSLISDVFKVNGWKVLHIMNENKIQEHPYTQAATIINNQLSYKKSF